MYVIILQGQPAPSHPPVGPTAGCHGGGLDSQVIDNLYQHGMYFILVILPGINHIILEKL